MLTHPLQASQMLLGGTFTAVKQQLQAQLLCVQTTSNGAWAHILQSTQTTKRGRHAPC